MSTLERAISIAAEAHAGQVDKASAPYILHPLRVMLRLESFEARVVAVLHDVVEDTAWTFDRLRAEGFSPSVIAALDALTRRDHETYEAFIHRAARHAIAREVKLADLQDNLDPSRIPDPTPRDIQRMQKYRTALALITSLCEQPS